MDQKTQFIADYLRQTLSFTELCALYHVSRKTGYKWVARYLESGGAGLEDRSPAPHTCPHRTPPELAEAIVEARRLHPTWGAGKLLALLGRRDPDRAWPSRSAACALLARRGLVRRARRRRSPGHPGAPASLAAAPNELWSADFKGQFKTGDGRYCYPLTVTDNFSRLLLGCRALKSVCVADSREVFRALFREYGLPRRIRTDNGVPFATVSLARLSRLSAWWVRLGVLPELIEPGCPQQNGRHERMHRTLKAETTRPPASGLRSQQRAFDRFREEYNRVRPHEALGMKTPASLYEPSPRPYPERPPPLEYPAHFETRYVSRNGGIRWRSDWVNVSITCAGEYVGLEEIDDGVWGVYFGPLKLGRLLEREMRIEDAYGKLWRHRQKV
jgi:transposase InsO family protein